MKQIIISLLSTGVIICSTLSSLWAQAPLPTNPEAQQYAQTITQEDLSRHLHVVAADSMEGRLTGKPGQKKAARYIANHFESLGLQAPVPAEEGNSYFQKFNYVNRSWEEVYIKASQDEFRFIKDFYVRGNSLRQEEFQAEAIFGGTIDPKEVPQENLQGKALVCFIKGGDDTPQTLQSLRQTQATAIMVITGDDQQGYEDKLAYEERYIKTPYKGLSGANRKDQVIFYLSPSAAARMLNTTPELLMSNREAFGKFKSAKPLKIKAEMKEEIQFSSENVLGFLEGSDKKDEILVITAHYDHIGARGDEINNGADDDGSGTVTVMELAEAFTQAKAEGKGPRRSILFMTVAGEELGLYGSRYYTDIDPVFPLENTVADLNIDMVGRIGGDYQETNDPNYVYLIGSDKLSTDLHELSEAVNQTYINLKLDYKYNDENDPNRFYYRSDHYNFAKNNIPIIFYFNGTHPDYHRPTDTVDKIHFPKMEKIGRLIFHTAWEIANREQRLVVDKK